MDLPLLANRPAPPSNSLRELFAASARFWELRRIAYNFLLSLVAVVWVVATWPHFRPVFAMVPLLQFAGLALLANVCYSSAYLLEFSLQVSPLQNSLPRLRRGLWMLGTLLALILENYWISDEIYPFIH